MIGEGENRLMRARNLLVVSLAAFGVVALPATAAYALLVKVSINFGPTVSGPDDGTLIVTANPGCILQIGKGLRDRGSPVRVLHLVEVLDQAYGGVR